MYITIWKCIWIEYKEYPKEFKKVKQTVRLGLNLLSRKREWRNVNNIDTGTWRYIFFFIIRNIDT